MARQLQHPGERRMNHDPGESRLLGASEVAKITGTSERYARRLFDERRFVTVKIGRYVRVWSHDLEAWLEQNTRPGIARSTK
jgi:excisionase family DNA binding protein